jgi:hypothetical protein
VRSPPRVRKVPVGPWTFKTTATAASALNIGYDFSGFMGYEDVGIELESYVLRAGVRTENTLVSTTGTALPSGAASPTPARPRWRWPPATSTAS